MSIFIWDILYYVGSIIIIFIIGYAAFKVINYKYNEYMDSFIYLNEDTLLFEDWDTYKNRIKNEKKTKKNIKENFQKFFKKIF